MDAEVIVSVVKLHKLLLAVGGIVLLKLLELLELLKLLELLELLELSELLELLRFTSRQDLQHI